MQNSEVIWNPWNLRNLRPAMESESAMALPPRPHGGWQNRSSFSARIRQRSRLTGRQFRVRSVLMKIVTYDELKDPYQFMKLMEPAFGWTPDPERVSRNRKLDERYRSPFGFGLLKGKNLVGFTGVMDIPVRTRDGKTERVGGLFAVATDPTCSRQGTATTLLEHAHKHFRERGYRFSFLCTSRSLVAHSLYEKLGYHDIFALDQIPRAYRLYPEKKRRERKGKQKQKMPDTHLVERIFEQAVRGRTGFAVRPKNWVRAYMDTKELKPESIFLQPGGYAVAQPADNSLFVYEFVAQSRKTYLDILNQMTKKGKRVMLVGHVYDPALEEILQQRGFRFRYRRYFILMCKPLAGVSFDQAFGRRFYFSALDSF